MLPLPCPDRTIVEEQGEIVMDPVGEIQDLFHPYRQSPAYPGNAGRFDLRRETVQYPRLRNLRHCSDELVTRSGRSRNDGHGQPGIPSQVSRVLRQNQASNIR